jgi:hypothetical protein
MADRNEFSHNNFDEYLNEWIFHSNLNRILKREQRGLKYNEDKDVHEMVHKRISFQLHTNEGNKADFVKRR